MRRSVCASVVVLGLVFSSSLSGMLRPPPEASQPPRQVAPRPQPRAFVRQDLPPPAMVDAAGPAEYARMLRHCLDFEWKQAESVARRYPDLVDGRDRTEYVQGLLYRMRTQRVTSLQDLAKGSVECARCAGVSLHNLMLFFRQQGTPGWRKLGMPTRLVYERGLKLAPGDVSLSIVRAGLLVDLGQVAEADRLFPEPPADAAELTSNDVINMAYYHAARRDRDQLLVWLERAKDRDLEATREWAEDSDDLDAYRNDARVIAVLKTP